MSKQNRILFFLLLECSILGLAACSYSFTGASVPAHLKSISIPVFADRSGSGEFDLGQKLTAKLTQKFIDDNTLLVANRTSANSVVEGAIVSINDAPAVVSSGETITSRRITVTVSATFKDLIKKETVFEKSFSNYSDYTIVTGDITAVRKAAIEDAIDKIAEDILLGVVSNW